MEIRSYHRYLCREYFDGVKIIRFRVCHSSWRGERKLWKLQHAATIFQRINRYKFCVDDERHSLAGLKIHKGVFARRYKTMGHSMNFRRVAKAHREPEHFIHGIVARTVLYLLAKFKELSF